MCRPGPCSASRRAILEGAFWVLPNAAVYYPVFDGELAEIKADISS